MNLSRHATYANVASTLAVVLALGGGGAAVAAGVGKNSVGSKQIKAGAVKTVDLAAGAVDSSRIKDGSVSGADLVDGTVELSDLSPATKAALSTVWDPSVPIVSGTTVTGSVFYSIDASSAAQDLPQSVALPARAPATMLSASFAVDEDPGTTDDDPLCTGTYNAPTAPPGRLCAYSSGIMNGQASLTTLFPGEDRGFVIRLVSADAGSTGVDLSWAYTAP